MKKIILIILLQVIFAQVSTGQIVQPLYIKFEGNQVGFRKYENSGFNTVDNFPNEDNYDSIYPLHAGFPLSLITYNKRDYVEINQSELANYNVKTIEEIRVMMASKTETEQLNFWGALHEQQKLYIIEILPNGKAKIVKVWVDYIH